MFVVRNSWRAVEAPDLRVKYAPGDVLELPTRRNGCVIEQASPLGIGCRQYYSAVGISNRGKRFLTDHILEKRITGSVQQKTHLIMTFYLKNSCQTRIQLSSFWSVRLVFFGAAAAK